METAHATTAGDQAPGLYVHVPFCASLCPYCDFAVVIAGDERRAEYLAAVAREAGLAAGHWASFDTLYLGGGTPSALPPEALAAIVDGLRARLPIADDPVLTLEVNPDDVTPERVAAWRALGCTRISLGLQSLDDDELRFLGRRHDAATARRAAGLLAEGGFETFSVDLIYGLPGQTVDRWRRRLEAALTLGPDHLSCYQLTIEPRTVLGRRRAAGRLVELGETVQAELFELTHRLLGDHGYGAYEVSSFAAHAEHRSRHNEKYWHHVPYLGLGPSAHSFDGRSRWWNEPKLRLWARALGQGELPRAGEERLGRRELALEAVMLGLRTTVGIDLGRLREAYDVDLVAANRRLVERLVGEGKLIADGRFLRPTLHGMAVADAIARAFELGEAMPDDPTTGSAEAPRAQRAGSGR